MLLLTMAAAAESVKKPGLPGVTAGEKLAHVTSTNPTMRLFRMRNVMTSWACQYGGEHVSRLGTCANLYDLGLQSTTPPKSSVNDMKTLYRTFCSLGGQHRHHDLICEDQLFRSKYGTP